MIETHKRRLRSSAAALANVACLLQHVHAELLCTEPTAAAAVQQPDGVGRHVWEVALQPCSWIGPRLRSVEHSQARLG